MIITVDIDKINKLKLSPTEYCVLKFLFEKDYRSLEGLSICDSLSWSNDSTFLGVLQHLEVRGWLKITKSGDFKFEDVILRAKSCGLFEVDSESKFLDLWNRYPVKVPDGNGGYRVLRPKSIDTSDGKKCLDIWKKEIKNKPELPDIMIKSLNKQLELTRSKLQFMQQFLVWMRNKTWEKYMDLITDEPKQETTEGI